MAQYRPGHQYGSGLSWAGDPEARVGCDLRTPTAGKDELPGTRRRRGEDRMTVPSNRKSLSQGKARLREEGAGRRVPGKTGGRGREQVPDPAWGGILMGPNRKEPFCSWAQVRDLKSKRHKTFFKFIYQK